jgi:hypothetical protein
MTVTYSVENALACALQLAAQGTPTFPVRDDKAPACPGGFNAATADKDKLTELWRLYPGSAVGVATGEASGWAVIDADSAKHPESDAWVSEHEEMLSSAYIYETRSGGRHFVFKHVPGLRCGQNVTARGIDIRAEGGYVIFWPANGCKVISAAPLAEFPPELIAQIQRPRLIEQPPHKLASSSADGGWFAGASESLKDEAVDTCLKAIGSSEDVLSHAEWRDIGFACRAAGRFEKFQAWSRRRTDYDEKAEGQMADIEARFAPGGIGVGTLISKARAAGGGAALDHLIGRARIDKAAHVFNPVDAADAATPNQGYEPRFRLARDIEPDTRPQLWEGFLRQQSVGILYAPPFAGKTIMAAGLACSVAHGLPFLDRECAQGSSYLIELEGAALLADNIKAWHRRHGREIPNNIGISEEQVSLTDAGNMEQVATDIEYFAQLYGACKLVIVDTLSQALAGEDENAQGPASSAARALKVLSQRTRATILVLHHTGKDLTRGMRGSSVLTAAADSVVRLEEADDGLIQVSVEKLKGGRLTAPAYFRIEEEILRQDHRGRDEGAAVAVHVRTEEALAIKQQGKIPSKDRLILDSLASAPLNAMPDAELQKRFEEENPTGTHVISSIRTAYRRTRDALIDKGKIVRDGNAVKLVDRHRREIKAASVFSNIEQLGGVN